MNERIIEIILYLVNQVQHDTPIEFVDVNRLSADGYTDAEIGAACCWLVDHAVFSSPDRSGEDRHGFRILHESERLLFQPEAYGYMLQLREIGLMNETQFETILNRAQVTGLRALSIADVKALIGTLLAESSDMEFGGSRLMLNSHDTVH